MDLLTHLFLPITVAYILWPDLFPSPWFLTLGVVAILPDVDKLFGLQGVLHAPISLGLLGGVVILAERWYRDDASYGLLILALLLSHLLLDFLDGGPVLVLYPLVDVGVGLQYPAELVLGDGLGSTGVRNPLPEIKTHVPDRSRTSYPLVTGYGVLSGLVFAVVALVDSFRDGWNGACRGS